MTLEDIALWIIVIQGFFVMFYEYDVWRMNRERFVERKSWRDAKRKQQVKKVELTVSGGEDGVSKANA